MRTSVPENALHAGIKRFLQIADDEVLVRKLNTLARAVSSFNKHDFNTSLVLCWFLLEQELNSRYSHYLQSAASNGHTISSDRKKFLEGRDFTASIISNILELNGYVTPAGAHQLR
jgi:hypothetical protein